MNIKKYNERHQQMLNHQKTVVPVVPMRQLEKLWGLSTTSAVDYSLRKMEKFGMVKRIPRGKYGQYVAVEVCDE